MSACYWPPPRCISEGVGRFCIEPGAHAVRRRVRVNGRRFWTTFRLDSPQIDAHSLANAGATRGQTAPSNAAHTTRNVVIALRTARRLSSYSRAERCNGVETDNDSLGRNAVNDGHGVESVAGRMALEIAGGGFRREHHHLLSERQTALALCEQRVQRAQDDAAHMRAGSAGADVGN